MCPQFDHTPRHRHIALLKHLRSPSFLLWDDSTTGRALIRRSPRRARSNISAYASGAVRVQTPERLYVPDEQTPPARKMYG